MADKKLNVGVVGATGYTGLELLRLLAMHPLARVDVVTSRAEQGRRVADVFPWLRGRLELPFSEPDAASLRSCDLVFFATPHGTAMSRVPELLEAGVRVVDLSADFRLTDAVVWSQWYGMDHACPDLLPVAVYGLPEVNREQIRSAALVANPGCYPTVVNLGLLPLARNRAIDPGDIIVDAKSGVSGAGRKVELSLLHAEVSESFRAYSASGHRHAPEIGQVLSQAFGEPVELCFVPHLVPMIRGIHATMYVAPRGRDDIQSLFEEFYRNEPFVDVLPPDTHPETRTVRGTNLCRISVHRQGQRVIVLSVIDNLVKGAAGQALQNMNLMFGLAETTGLDLCALSP